MFSFIVGLIFASSLYHLSKSSWVLIVAFCGCALILQILYTHRLNAFLGGNDPVATFGVRNLKQLRSSIHIPLLITILSFLAKSFAWAGLVALFFSLGWFTIDQI